MIAAHVDPDLVPRARASDPVPVPGQERAERNSLLAEAGSDVPGVLQRVDPHADPPHGAQVEHFLDPAYRERLTLARRRGGVGEREVLGTEQERPFGAPLPRITVGDGQLELTDPHAVAHAPRADQGGVAEELGDELVLRVGGRARPARPTSSSRPPSTTPIRSASSNASS